MIHGHNPTHQDLERRIGLAGHGRYRKEPGANPYDVVHGAAFEQELHGQIPACLDSGFQTIDSLSRRKAVAKAKVKASMTATRYKNIAAEDGYDIWAEAKDEMIIHSEQYQFTIKLDSEGNAENCANLTGRLVPNIWKQERRVEGRSREQPQDALRYPETASINQNTTSTASVRQVGMAPLNPKQQNEQDDQSAPRQIAAVEPSLREISEDVAMSDGDSDAECHGGDLDRSSAYATDDDAYVVYDARKVPDMPLQTAAIALESPRKRKYSHKDKNKARGCKRLKITAAMNEDTSTSDSANIDARRRQKRPRSQDRDHAPTRTGLAPRESLCRTKTLVSLLHQLNKSTEPQHDAGQIARRSRSPERRHDWSAREPRHQPMPTAREEENSGALNIDDGPVRRPKHRSKSPARTQKHIHTRVKRMAKTCDSDTQSNTEQITTHRARSVQSLGTGKDPTHRRSRSPAPSELRNGTTARDVLQHDLATRGSTQRDENTSAILLSSLSDMTYSSNKRRAPAMGPTIQQTEILSHSYQDGSKASVKSRSSYVPKLAILEDAFSRRVKAGTPPHVDHPQIDRTREVGNLKCEAHNAEMRVESTTSPLRVHESRLYVAHRSAVETTEKESRTMRSPSKQGEESQEKNVVQKPSRANTSLRKDLKTDRRQEVKSTFKTKEIQQVRMNSHDVRKVKAADNDQNKRVAEIERKKKMTEAEQKKQAEEAERRKAEVKARIAERHARRAPRMDLQRYVPRALREADHGDTAGHRSNHTNYREGEGRNGRGRRL
jgi:hypothetical protein